MIKLLSNIKKYKSIAIIVVKIKNITKLEKIFIKNNYKNKYKLFS